MLGYDAARSQAFYDRALERVRAIPGVESAALAERLPFSINYNRNNVYLPDRHGPDDKGLVLDVARVSPEYFRRSASPIVQGRNFAPTDTPKSPGVAIVNEAMARTYWPNQNAIGKRIRVTTYNGRELEVVGVSADYKISTMGEGATPYLHYAVSQRPDSGEEIVARTRGDAGALLSAMRLALLALEPNVIFLDNQTMDAQVAATLLPAKAGALSVSAVGVVAMMLAAIGLYGVIAYSVARRTREIGIRMALGAQPSAVVGLVMKQGLGIAAVGIGVGARAGPRRREGDGRRALRRQLRRSDRLEHVDRVAAPRGGDGQPHPRAPCLDRRSVERAALRVRSGFSRTVIYFANVSRTIRPLTMVIAAAVAGSLSVSTVKISCVRTATSASIPALN